jgi:hypothetical protein
MGDLFDFDVLILPSQASPPEDHETVVAIVPLRDIDLLNRFRTSQPVGQKSQDLRIRPSIRRHRRNIRLDGKSGRRRPCRFAKAASTAAAYDPGRTIFDAKRHPTVIRQKTVCRRARLSEPAVIDLEIREPLGKRPRPQRPCPAGSFAASRTAARHSRLTGKIGGMGARSGSGVGAAIESMFSVREALRMKRL